MEDLKALLLSVDCDDVGAIELSVFKAIMLKEPRKVAFSNRTGSILIIFDLF